MRSVALLIIVARAEMRATMAVVREVALATTAIRVMAVATAEARATAAKIAAVRARMFMTTVGAAVAAVMETAEVRAWL